MKYLRSVRGRMLGIAFIPGSALVVVALVIAGFLVHQAVRTREQAMDTAAAADRTARAVVSLQGQRAAAMATPDHRSSAYAIFTQRIDTTIAGLRDYARRAPDAESGYQQTTAIQLLSVAEGMYRADSLALAGLDDVTRRSFVLAVAAYRAELAQVSGQLTETGREAYEAVTRSADWSRLAAAEDALAAAEPLPIPESTWRGAAYTVSLQLGQLYTRQSQYAVQLTLDDGRRTLAGALAASTGILLCAVLLLLVVRRLVARVPVPVVPIMVPTIHPAAHAAIPRPRHTRSPVPREPEPWPMKAVFEGLRRR
ncbi:nitrate- and nitrite sensing domain-containing protein [Amycolatopsis sp. WQ 127309]|uniref:nitrate- and nitrite sensing domain-containing protein n=1 Tax=Amycolatopsis sp. WQ 127309 TaxID=2932773 RepID=UPI001FF57AE4|nr:nitrate- and nitrite sensing domain-containing protein [Amycolatopsis sp. WQ 127309]UOZ09173.1 nitrate- and nitrite sensing domain-containing protein [Amycolatopsis sp. WQ 127309]